MTTTFFLFAAIGAVTGVVALLLNLFQYRLAAKRRKDDLFDRRYEFYRQVRSMWLNTGNGAPPGQRPWLDIKDLIPVSEEASFLFGQDIAQHICSLADKKHDGSPFFPDDDFVKPFRKYLSLS